MGSVLTVLMNGLALLLGLEEEGISPSVRRLL